MELTKHNVQIYLEHYSSKIDKFVKDKVFDYNSLQSLLKEFDKISAFLMSDNDTPDIVKNFLSDEYLNPEIKLPAKYKNLNCIFKLRNYVKSYSEEHIKALFKKKEYKKAIEILALAVQTDIRNVVMVENILDLYRQHNMYQRIVELYQMMFVYTMDPLYFEKIGDTYFSAEKYQEAIDSYLNCAEYTDDNVGIYEKLADVFGKINDNESRIACLNHIKVLRGANDK